MQHQKIYKTLDNVPRVLFWPIDEFLVLVIPMFLGVLIGSFLLMVLGIALKPFYMKAKKAFPKGSMIHRLYWRLPKSAFNRFNVLKRLPESCLRRFIS